MGKAAPSKDQHARGRGERGKWHGGLRGVWMMLGNMAGASISKEVSGFLPSSNMRADLVGGSCRCGRECIRMKVNSFGTDQKMATIWIFSYM